MRFFLACMISAITLLASASTRALTSAEADVATSGGVALVRGNSSTFVLASDTCSASLIAPNVALTARHCVERMSPPEGCSGTFTGVRTHPYYAVQTALDITGPSPQRHVVSAIRTPVTAKSCDDDIAVLVLADVVPSAVVTPIEPIVGSPPASGTAYTAIGYGGTSSTSPEQDGRRRRRSGLDVACVGGACGFSSALWMGLGVTCNGDSGGPALDTQGRTFGVAIRGNACLGATTASVYVRTDVHAKLIVDAVKEAATVGGYAAPAWATLPAVEDVAPRHPTPDAPRSEEDETAPVAPPRSVVVTEEAGGCSAAPGRPASSTGCALLVVFGAACARRRRGASGGRSRI